MQTIFSAKTSSSKQCAISICKHICKCRLESFSEYLRSALNRFEQLVIENGSNISFLVQKLMPRLHYHRVCSYVTFSAFKNLFYFIF